MQKSCTSCGQMFEITKDDLILYDRLSPTFGSKKCSLPAPDECPDCRYRQRITFRNERQLYHRKCDLSGKQIISIYSPDKPYKVYDQEVWWNDTYDPLTYGREYDFNRSFFEQFAELDTDVPKIAIFNAKSETCAYTNYSAENKNCYLLVGGLGAEDVYYSYRVFYSKNIIDCYDLYKCERCYECRECKNLYECSFCDHCHQSNNLTLCSFCTGCQDCIGCVNLRNKRYCIFNEQHTKEEYQQKGAELMQYIDIAQEKYRAFRLTMPHNALQVLGCEDCRGDALIDCKNCRNCFTLKGSQDCNYCITGENNKSCIDCNFFDNCELQYNSSNLEKNYNVICGCLAWYVSDSAYVASCFNSKNLFGCSGMKKHQYCILNKQYTKEEYENLVPKIIEQMQKAGEWGEFFPPSISPFGYNETVAMEEFPLNEKEVKKLGWKWHAEEKQAEQYLGPAYEIPKNIDDVDDSICKQVLLCEVTCKPYKVIPQELKLYRQMQVPVPRKCPNQRHKERIALRNPRKLWQRECINCKKSIETSYAPDRPEIVYCNDCYLKTVY